MDIIITKKKLNRRLMGTLGLNIVYFKRDRHGVSNSLDHDLLHLAAQFGDTVNFFTINVEYETGIDYEYNIMELPTVILFKKGSQVDCLSGSIDRGTLTKSIEKHINLLS